MCSLMQCTAIVQNTSNRQRDYLISASFKLRLDKHYQDSSRPQHLTDSWHDLQDRDERQVQRYEVHRDSVSRQILQLEVAQVGAINDNNSGVCSQTLSYLETAKQHHQILHACLDAVLMHEVIHAACDPVKHGRAQVQLRDKTPISRCAAIPGKAMMQQVYHG